MPCLFLHQNKTNMPSTTGMSATAAAPVNQSERIIILDSLRGIAVLGILLMNIPGFAFPQVNRLDNSVLGEWSGPNYYVWYLVEWIMEGSQRAIFSLLFGAGTILFVSRLEKRTEGLMPAEYFIRRQLWLLLFGLFNAYVLLWFWDVLFHYAIFGIILFAFRRVPPKGLLIAAGVCMLLMMVRENVDLLRDKKVISRGEAVTKIDTLKTKLTDQQKEQLGEMTGFKERSAHESKIKRMEKQLKEVRGSYIDLYRNHSNQSYHYQTAGTYHFLFWDVLLFMFIGMAFFKMGILTGEAPIRVYVWLFVIGMVLGLILSYFRLQPLIEAKHNDFEYSRSIKMEFYEISRLFRSLGVFGLIMLMYKSGWFKWLFALMRPVGQMAFTNYLTQSFLCGLFFYGIGFGMFGKLQRYEMYYVVAAVWVLQIIWSHIWLRYFRFGPLEWLWRSLTYWKRQPFRKGK